MKPTADDALAAVKRLRAEGREWVRARDVMLLLTYDDDVRMTEDDVAPLLEQLVDEGTLERGPAQAKWQAGDNAASQAPQEYRLIDPPAV